MRLIAFIAEATVVPGGSSTTSTSIRRGRPSPGSKRHPSVPELDRVSRRAATSNGRTARAFNPPAREEVCLFHAVLDGADTLRGFSNYDVRSRLEQASHLARFAGDRKRSAKVSRILHRFHAHGLVAKISRSRRWRTTRPAEDMVEILVTAQRPVSVMGIAGCAP